MSELRPDPSVSATSAPGRDSSVDYGLLCGAIGAALMAAVTVVGAAIITALEKGNDEASGDDDD